MLGGEPSAVATIAARADYDVGNWPEKYKQQFSEACNEVSRLRGLLLASAADQLSVGHSARSQPLHDPVAQRIADWPDHYKRVVIEIVQEADQVILGLLERISVPPKTSEAPLRQAAPLQAATAFPPKTPLAALSSHEVSGRDIASWPPAYRIVLESLIQRHREAKKEITRLQEAIKAEAGFLQGPTVEDMEVLRARLDLEITKRVAAEREVEAAKERARIQATALPAMAEAYGALQDIVKAAKQRHFAAC